MGEDIMIIYIDMIINGKIERSFLKIPIHPIIISHV